MSYQFVYQTRENQFFLAQLYFCFLLYWPSYNFTSKILPRILFPNPRYQDTSFSPDSCTFSHLLDNPKELFLPFRRLASNVQGDVFFIEIAPSITFQGEHRLAYFT